MNILLITNPSAGKGKAEAYLPKLKSFFLRNCSKLDIYKTKQRGDAFKKAKKCAGKYDTIIAVGGDGTVNEVVNGIAKSKSKLGIIPIGTTNVFARQMDIPSNPIEACKVILKNRVRRVDLGKVNNQYFLLMAGVGFDASALNKVEPFFKKIIGIGAYSIAVLEELIRHNPPLLKITYEGRTTEGYFVVIGNIKSYGLKFFQVTPYAEMDDGFLDVCVFKDKLDLINFLKYISEITIKQHTTSPDVVYFKAKKIKIDSKEKALVQVDGDVICRTPVAISIVPKSISIICP